MILPGTRVMYLGGYSSVNGPLREGGVYTVRKWNDGEKHCYGLSGFVRCDAGNVWLCEVSGNLRTRAPGAFCFCNFRIIAPPITEADRLEASAPDAPAKPKRVRA